jgi:hypothetical protein
LDVQVIELAKILKHSNSLSSGEGWDEGAKLSGQKTNITFCSRKPDPNPLPKGEGTQQTDTLPTRIMAMLFADAVNFSKLTEQQIPFF